MSLPQIAFLMSFVPYAIRRSATSGPSVRPGPASHLHISSPVTSGLARPLRPGYSTPHSFRPPGYRPQGLYMSADFAVCGCHIVCVAFLFVLKARILRYLMSFLCHVMQYMTGV